MKKSLILTVFLLNSCLFNKPKYPFGIRALGGLSSSSEIQNPPFPKSQQWIHAKSYDATFFVFFDETAKDYDIELLEFYSKNDETGDIIEIENDIRSFVKKYFLLTSEKLSVLFPENVWSADYQFPDVLRLPSLIFTQFLDNQRSFLQFCYEAPLDRHFFQLTSSGYYVNDKLVRSDLYFYFWDF